LNFLKLSAALFTLSLAAACQGGSNSATPAPTVAVASDSGTGAGAATPSTPAAPYEAGNPALPPPGIDDKPAVLPATDSAPPAEPTPTPAEPARSDAGSGTPAKPGAAQHGPYVLGKGMTADIGPATTLSFERIVSDSRCPKDVQCIWAGEVTIALRLKSPAGSDSFELSGRANSRTVQGHSIELMSYEACPGGPAVTPLPGECAILRVDQAAER
jgi:hypothetical protein